MVAGHSCEACIEFDLGRPRSPENSLPLWGGLTSTGPSVGWVWLSKGEGWLEGRAGDSFDSFELLSIFEDSVRCCRPDR